MVRWVLLHIKAQGVVNMAPDESAPKQVTYEDFMKQLQQLEKQINADEAAAKRTWRR